VRFHFSSPLYSKNADSPGTLVKCDASIKAMLVDIDSKNGNEYIIEELDEEHILVKESKVNELKARLNEVRISDI
jgi:TFIIH basal transcription factor complex TTD-A subunit